MSNFSYSQSPLKRSRTMSQMTSQTNNVVYNMLSAPSSRTYVTPKREVGGAGVQRAGTAGKKKKISRIPSSWINKMLFPITRLKLLNYGENMYGLTTGTAFSRQGNCKALRGLPGKQFWFEGYALPLYQPIFGATGDTVIGSIVSLMDLARAAKQNATLTATDAGLNGSTGITPVSVLSNTSIASGEDQLIESKISYLGGYQKHTFVNISNAHTFIELYELHPRDVMFDWVANGTVGTSGKYVFKSVGDEVLKDYEENSKNLTTAITWSSGVDLSPTPLRYDDVQDPLVMIKSNCRRVHALYKVSKPIKIALAPGETFHYTLRLDPFEFEEGELLKHITTLSNGGSGVNHNVLTRPTAIPKFTRRLVVRAWGEVGHSAITNTVTGDVTVAQNTAQPTVVANVQCDLMHLQEEFHAVRFCPKTNDNKTILINMRDEPSATTGESWALEIMNEEMDGEEVVDR